LSLRWFDVDFELDQIRVRETKSGEERYIPMNRTLTDILAKVRVKSNSEYVFSKRDGSRYKDIRRPFEKALREARIGKIRFHDFRRTFASHMVMSGADLMTVKEIMGHKSLKMTMRYSHSSEDQRKLAVERLDTRPHMDPEAENSKKQACQSS